MPRIKNRVKVQNTHVLPDLGAALVELIGFLNSPRRDGALLHEADVELDRAMLPLVVALDKRGPLGVVTLADLAGRDHTTISRQLSKLESLALVKRSQGATDRRKRLVELTGDGRAVARAVTSARQRLLSQALADWSDADRAALADLTGRFARALASLDKAREQAVERRRARSGPRV